MEKTEDIHIYVLLSIFCCAAWKFDSAALQRLRSQPSMIRNLGGEKMQKIGGIASTLAILLAIVAGVVNIPGLDVALVILVLAIIAGIWADQDNAVRMFLAVLVLPVVAAALASIPAVGGYLSAIFGNVAIAAAGVSASLIARRIYEMVMGTITGLTSGNS
ncbi:hypothetical protein [Altererythrobacter sp. Z27]|uniref:hypothetical protein n=1 Tax=Altererythrobacter sp. Z27 TaxID=3461147 RepID=UPI004044CA0A